MCQKCPGLWVKLKHILARLHLSTNLADTKNSQKIQHIQYDFYHNSKYSIFLFQVTTRNINMSQRLNHEIFDHNWVVKIRDLLLEHIEIWHITSWICTLLQQRCFLLILSKKSNWGKWICNINCLVGYINCVPCLFDLCSSLYSSRLTFCPSHLAVVEGGMNRLPHRS